MTIGIDDSIEGRFLRTEVCVIDKNTIVVETISIKTLLNELSQIPVIQGRINDLLFIAYPDSTIVRENFKPLTNIQADAKQIESNRKTDSMRS